jgi:hypothetical protein
MLISASITDEICAMDVVRTALRTLAHSTNWYYRIKRGIAEPSLDLANVATAVDLALPENEGDQCRLLAAGRDALKADPMGATEHGGYVLEMCRIALGRAEEAGLYVREDAR